MKSERTQLGIDQATMAARMGLSQSAYSRIEAGETTMNVWQLRQCAHLLRKSVTQLVDQVDRYEAHLAEQGIEIVAERRTNPAAALIGLAILAAVLSSK